jgi:hypothetical protein
MTECKYCKTPITWSKRAGRPIPLNIDGTDHHCKDGVNTPSTEKPPTQIGKLIMYAGNQAMLLLKDGKEHSYAITSEIRKDWQGCGFLLPAENHPDIWLDFSVDPKGYIRPGAKVVLCPEWSKILTDPTNGDVKSPFRNGKEILEQNLKEKIAESAAKPSCFKPALCPKGCDGTKDPCQFKPKVKPAQPKEPAPPQDPPANPAPEGSPSSSVGEKPAIQTNPQEAMKIEQGREMLESILNADPRVIDHIAEHDPELWDAFREKMLGVIPDKKTPDLKLPSESELVTMTLDYNSYWKAKTLADIVVRHDIRKQVEFKNWTECLNLAITFHKMDHPSHAELQKLYTTAALFHRFINDRLNKVPLLDEVTKDA